MPRFKEPLPSLSRLTDRIGGGSSAIPAEGSAFEGGYFVGMWSGYALIAAPIAGEVSRAYRTSAVGTSGTYTSFDGVTNTNALKAISSNLSAFPAALYCEDLVYGGYTDWYLPASGEMILFQKASELFPVGEGMPNGTPYWSSTMAANGGTVAWAILRQNANLGGISSTSITTSARVRPFRRVLL